VVKYKVHRSSGDQGIFGATEKVSDEFIVWVRSVIDKYKDSYNGCDRLIINLADEELELYDDYRE
jgi:hypothetical protein